MDTPKTPIMNNLLNILSGLSAGHEKALKQGIYNAVALFLLCIVSSAGYGLYLILRPFLKPLIWALLCGSVLFPFKYYLSTMVQSWFAEKEASHKPFLFSLAVVPMSTFDKVSEFLGSFLQKYLRYIVYTCLIVIGSVTIYKYTPAVLCYITWKIFSIFNFVLGYCIAASNTYLVSL